MESIYKVLLVILISLTSVNFYAQDVFNSDTTRVAHISIDGVITNINNQTLGSISMLTGEVRNAQNEIIGTVTSNIVKNVNQQIIATITETTHGKYELKDGNNTSLGFIMYGNEVYNANNVLVLNAPEAIIHIYLAGYYLFF